MKDGATDLRDLKCWNSLFPAEFGWLRLAYVAGAREAAFSASKRQQPTPLPHPYALRPSDWHAAKERKVSTYSYERKFLRSSR